jgi:hypothetical protein
MRLDLLCVVAHNLVGRYSLLSKSVKIPVRFIWVFSYLLNVCLYVECP